MKRFIVRLFISLATPILLASCASSVRHDGSIKQCSDTPQNSIAQWFIGVAARDTGILRALVPDGASLFETFSNNKGERGQAIVYQIFAHPVTGKDDGCECTLLSITDDTPDSRIKIVAVKSVLYVDDEQRSYKRVFRVHFDPHGNCITSIESIHPKWERME